MYSMHVNHTLAPIKCMHGWLFLVRNIFHDTMVSLIANKSANSLLSEMEPKGAAYEQGSGHSNNCSTLVHRQNIRTHCIHVTWSVYHLYHVIIPCITRISVMEQSGHC